MAVKNISNDTMVLIASDQHLGARKSKSEEFKAFLDQVIYKLDNEMLKKLKAFLLLGDFFDIVMDTYKDISTDFKEIYNRLDVLLENGIHVIITLGNHEISIRKPLEKRFKRRKNKMVRKFQRKKLRNKFLKRENMCQYIVLRKNENEQLEMITYDSKNHIDKTRFVKAEILGNIPHEGPLKGRYKCLFTHGFQFEPEKFSFFALIWCFLLRMPGFIKELFDILWNGIIKTPERPAIEQIDKAEFNRRIKENKKMLNKKQKISYFLFKRFILKELVKEAERRAAIKDNSEFNKVIEESYIDDFLELGITHVVYGHSHTKQEDVVIKGVPVFNTGGWQQVSEPAFIEIHSNGDIRVKSYTQKEEISNIEA